MCRFKQQQNLDPSGLKGMTTCEYFRISRYNVDSKVTGFVPSTSKISLSKLML